MRMLCAFCHRKLKQGIEHMPTSDEKLTSLLQDLEKLSTYLHGRGDKTLALSKQFEENARKDLSNQEFDQRQAIMLDYHHQRYTLLVARFSLGIGLCQLAPGACVHLAAL